jgi:YVTN family beta-propeller protein
MRNDADPDPEIAYSMLYCGSATSAGIDLPPGSALRLATIHYNVLQGEGTGTFTVQRLALGLDGGSNWIQICHPYIENFGPCFPATIDLGTPSPTNTPCSAACPSSTGTPTPTSTSTPVPTPTSTACATDAYPLFVPVTSGTITDVLIDRWCQTAFALNPSENRLEVFSLTDGVFEAPIPTGVRPSGFDFSPDGRTLYVANAGSSDIRVLDVLSRTEVRRINIPLIGFCQGAPMSLATASNGKVFFATGHDSCSSGNIVELDPTTGLWTERLSG